MTELKDKLAGKFLVIDGPDGAGKTTQLKLLHDHLTGEGVSVEVAMDPGTTKIGQKIRSLLLDRDNGEISPICEALLFMASRAQLMEECILPALEQRKAVLCDRFVSATIAYQGASGVSKDAILQLAEVAIQGRWPDLTVILDLPVKDGFERLGLDRARLKRPSAEELEKIGGGPPKGKPKVLPGQLFLFGDRMEHRSSEYHERVREIFRKLGQEYPAKVRYVDAMGTPEEVSARMMQVLCEEFAGSPAG